MSPLLKAQLSPKGPSLYTIILDVRASTHEVEVGVEGYTELICLAMANVAQPYEKAHRHVVARRMPNPLIGSPVENQACIIPSLLCDLLLLKLHHP